MGNGYRIISCAFCPDSAVAYSDSEAAAWLATHRCRELVGASNG